ncbi:MAG: signal peptidase II [Firmicutes bacterium]|nr:signal peptidase II [Bacillota bacterium]MBQ5960045.1 signal peptidase II [Bacillota bacterium]
MDTDMRTRRILQIVFFIVGTALLTIADYEIKQWAIRSLKDASAIDVIPGVFRFSYVENRGAAFGIFQGKSLILGIFSVIVGVLIGYLYFKAVPERKNWLLELSLLLIFAGAAGNQIDRLTQGYVVDMFEFYWFSFPVFNFADTLITIGAVLFGLFAIIRPKQLDQLFEGRKKGDRNG